jgi:thymidine kinase
LSLRVPADHLTRIAAVIRIPPQRGGWLEVICGPMFSGKSEEMIRRLRRAEIAGQSVVIFKPRIDDRYDVADVVSHAGARMRGVPVSSVGEVADHAKGFDVVGIDEVQFFEPSIVALALEHADRGVRVVVAGLDQDFRRLPFGPIPDLLSYAEFVDKLQAVCHRCGGPATTTQRLVDGQPAPYSGETVLVGAAEQYEARCRACHEPGVGAALAAA